MSRKFKPYGKKRGHRRSGSRSMGRLGETLFFGAFFFAGCGALAVMTIQVVIPEWRANHDFVEHTCRVTGAEIEEVADEDGISFRPLIAIQYEVDGESYSIETYDIGVFQGGTYTNDRGEADKILGQYKPGDEITCWYDAEQPGRAVVRRGYRWWIWPFLLIPVAFIIIGGGGLIYAFRHWGKSREHSAATDQRATARDLFEEPTRGKQVFPNVPSVEDITNSPGTTLAYRLPISTSPGWKLLGTLLLCLFWNGIVGVFVVLAITGHRDGNGNWLMTAFLIPFVAVGLWAIYYFLRQLLVTTGVGPTRVEICDHPLYPDRDYDLLVSQTGRLSMNSLVFLLACEESATYQQGTDTRTDTERIYEQEVYSHADFEIEPGGAFEGRCRFRIPAEAMHSFKSDHNEVKWQLIVKGNVSHWPDFERSFPVVVYPSSPTENVP